MAQYDIAKTKIGTGETANIADDNAVPIYKNFHFPKDWSKAFDFDFFNTESDVSISILHGKITTDAQLSVGLGLAGPNWAGTMEVEGSVDGDSMQLDVTTDNFVSGMLIGAAIDFTFNLGIQLRRETFHFEWGLPPSAQWKMAWHDLFRETSVTQVDMLTMMFNLAKSVVSLGKYVPGLSKVLKVLPDIDLPIPRSYNQGIANHISSHPWFTGGLDFPTELEATWDLVQIAEAVGGTAIEVAQPETTPLVELTSKLNKVLKGFIKPSVETGPVFGCKFITFLRISGINASWGSTTYELTDVGQLGSGILAGLPAAAQSETTPPDRLGVRFDHRPAVEFDLGWYVKVSWLKIFSYQKQEEIGAGDIWSGFTTPIGLAYTYDLSNAQGTTTVDDIDVHIVGNGWLIH